MPAKNILMLVGDFVEDYEVMVPFQALAMLGHTVDVVCPTKRAGDMIITVIHDFEGLSYNETRGHNFRLNANFDAVRESDYQGLMIPGGRSPEYLRLYPRVIEIVQHFAETQKPIAAVCHGAQILAAAGVLQGRTLTAYRALRPEMEMCGCIWVDPREASDGAQVDGNLITGVSWPSHPALLREFVNALDAAPAR